MASTKAAPKEVIRIGDTGTADETAIPPSAAGRGRAGTVPLGRSAAGDDDLGVVADELTIAREQAVEPVAVTPVPAVDDAALAVPRFDDVDVRGDVVRQDPIAETPVDVGPADSAPVLRCPAGHTNDASRRFCATCGAVLQDLGVYVPQPEAAAPSGLQPTKVPWYRKTIFRRLRRATGDGNVFLSGGLSPTTIVFRALGVFGGGLAIILMMPPWGTSVRAWFQDRITSFQPESYEVIEFEPRLVKNGANPLDTGAPANLADAEPNTLFKAPWNFGVDDAADVECGLPRGEKRSPGVVLTVAEGTEHVDRIEVDGGYGNSDESSVRLEEFRPRVIDFTFREGECVRLELDDSEDPQSVEIPAEIGVDAPFITMVVQAVYGDDLPGRTPVGIREVRLQRSKD